MAHSNSIAAYLQDLITGKISKRCQRILEVLGTAKMTDREIMIDLGYSDMNAARPRITEMIASGILRDVGSVRDSRTGKKCRVVARVVVEV